MSRGAKPSRARPKAARGLTEAREQRAATAEVLRVISGSPGDRDLTATAEILRVISRSPTDVQPVFEAIVKSAMRLLSAFSAVVRRLVDEELLAERVSF